ncbi:MAG: RNA-directed DNA polymerase [Raoultibacter sp.]
MSSKQQRYQRRHEKRLAAKREALSPCLDFDAVFSFEHFLEASFICQRGVLWKARVQSFVSNRSMNCSRLSEAMLSGTYKKRPADHFVIRERGKVRNIAAVGFEDRIVQRVFCKYSLLPVLTRGLITDNGASLEGKGVAFALKRFDAQLRAHIKRYGHNGYILLYDFSNYFGNIDKAILTTRIKRDYADVASCTADHLNLARFSKLIDQLFLEEKDGLGLGNQTSQIGAIYFASPIDHAFKEGMCIAGYGRYMDDGYNPHHNNAAAQNYRQRPPQVCAHEAPGAARRAARGKLRAKLC